MRRINAKYVIATSTKLDTSKVVLPENVNDAFFDRVNEKKAKTTDAEIFDVKKEVSSRSETSVDLFLKIKKKFFFSNSNIR